MLRVFPDEGAKLHLLTEAGGKEDDRCKYVQVVPSTNNKVFCSASDVRALAIVELPGKADRIYGVQGSGFNVKRGESGVVIESPSDGADRVKRTANVKGSNNGVTSSTGTARKHQDVLPEIKEDRYCVVTLDAKRLLELAKAMDTGDGGGGYTVTLIVKTKENQLSSREIGEMLDDARPDRDAVAKLCEEISWSHKSYYGSIGHKCSGNTVNLCVGDGEDSGLIYIFMGYGKMGGAIAFAGPFPSDKPRSPYDVADALLADYDSNKIAKMAAAVDTNEPVAVISQSGRSFGCIKQAYSRHSPGEQIKRYEKIRKEFCEAADKDYDTPF